MTLTALSFKCPKCGSSDVIYSCNPSCCFNHVCSDCYATFEPETVRVGEYAGEIGDVPDIDASGPTAPCVRCGEYRLFGISDDPLLLGQVLCVSCRALLSINFEPS